MNLIFRYNLHKEWLSYKLNNLMLIENLLRASLIFLIKRVILTKFSIFYLLKKQKKFFYFCRLVICNNAFLWNHIIMM